MTIWCVGRNYADHALEMGHKPEKTQPLIFAKSAGCLVQEGGFKLPPLKGAIHHELELVLRFGMGIRTDSISLPDTMPFDAMAIGLDLTARDIQDELKMKGQPWELAKSFKNSALISKFVPMPNDQDFSKISFKLLINRELRQQGTTPQMIYTPIELSTYLQTYFPVRPGDLLYTGTPSGVGPLCSNDTIQAEITGYVEAQWTVNV